MTKIDLFIKLVEKAKEGGYNGPDHEGRIGFLLDETNYYSIIFRKDFAKAIWGEDCIMHGMYAMTPAYIYHLLKMIQSIDKWDYLENNVHFN